MLQKKVTVDVGMWRETPDVCVAKFGGELQHFVGK
ncbi:hypothetical protein NIES4101_46420 [Calothrix sp. NIES-4101]|nr:hypothetical protein NIES4101_46420 [Calothrix sp. NIES-4101]